jgi:hypothetical protein
MCRRITRTHLGLAMLLTAGAALAVDGQSVEIGIIDLYGMNKVSARDVRDALTFKEGDRITEDAGEPQAVKSSKERLAKLPGVVRARIEVVCCDSGRVIVFVGIEEQGAPALRLRPAPEGDVRLPADIDHAGDEFSKALMLAVQRGDAGEDRSKGHSLMHDPAARAVQERFVVFARRDPALLRLVLRNSSDAGERALAAQVLGYVGDKQSVVDDLERGMSDPDENVRNNAMRALMVFADAAPGPDGSTPHVPPGPFIELLNSPVWSDRNKASGALMALSARMDRRALAELRKSALTPLVEMARWKSAGHALAAFMILARVAGYTDGVARGLWVRGNREVVIEGAIQGR